MLNKREFFRLKLAVPFSFTVLESQDSHIPTQQVFSYQTRDLSGGGLRLETSLALRPGDRLRLKLMMPALEAIRIQGRVVWNRRQRGREDELFWVGVAFDEIGDDEQDRIVGFLFRAQIEERQRSRPPLGTG